MPTERPLSLIVSKTSIRNLLRCYRGALSQPAAPLVVAGIIVVCGGIAMRLVNVRMPNALTFDEHHFVENARNYLGGQADWNDHPPLGKLLIAVGIALVGDNGLGWRIAPLIFGVGSIGMAFALGRTAFQSRLAGLMAAAFVAADGFLIAYSKSALLDGFLVFFQLLTVYLALGTKGGTGVLLTGACWGLAMGIKFSGAVMALPIAVILATRIRPLSRAAVLTVGTGLVAVVVYLAQFSLGLALAGKPYGFESSMAVTWDLYQHHARLTDWKNPLTSRWYSWFIPQKPIMMYREPDGPYWRVMSSLGNLLLWWSSAVAALTCVLIGVRRGVLQLATGERRSRVAVPGHLLARSPGPLVAQRARLVHLSLPW